MKYHAFILAGMLLVIALCSACGQKGDLFLPEEPLETERTGKESS